MRRLKLFIRLYFVCRAQWFGVWSKASTVPSSHAKQQKPPAPYVCAHQWVHKPYAWMCWCNAFSMAITSLFPRNDCVLLYIYIHICSWVSRETYVCTVQQFGGVWSEALPACSLTGPCPGIGGVCAALLLSLSCRAAEHPPQCRVSHPSWWGHWDVPRKRCALRASLAHTQTHTHSTCPPGKYCRTRSAHIDKFIRTNTSDCFLS